MRKFVSFLVLIMAAASVAISGCGGDAAGDTMDVKVAVTYNGEPLAGCSVTFVPALPPPGQEKSTSTAKMAMGETDDLGNCVVKIAKGRYEVSFSTFDKPEGDMDPGKMQEQAEKTKIQGKQPKGNEGPSLAGEKAKSRLPEKFSNPKTSGIPEFSVDESTVANGLKFELKD